MNHLHRTLGSWLLALLVAGHPAVAETLPKERIPEALLAEVERVEARFVAALRQDCSETQCFVKGCSYQAHHEVTTVESRGLPGIGGPLSPEAAPPPQVFLTKVRCEYTYENTFEPARAKVLSARLAEKLSAGPLRVEVLARELPKFQQASPAPEAPPTLPAAPAVAQSPEWREQIPAQVWDRLVASMEWLFVIAASTLALLVAFWGYRRVGKDSLDEELLRAKSLAEAQHGETVVQPATDGDDTLLQGLRRDLGEHPDRLRRLLELWLDQREFKYLASLLEHVTPAAVALGAITDPTLWSARRELSEFLAKERADSLPPVTELVQAVRLTWSRLDVLRDPEQLVFQRVARLMGADVIAGHLEHLAPAMGLFTLTQLPYALLRDVVRELPLKTRLNLLEQAFVTNRISLVAMASVKLYFTAVLTSQPPQLPEEAWAPTQVGLEMDLRVPLSLLFAALAPAEREALRTKAKTSPRWLAEIADGDTVMSLPEATRKELLLGIDPLALAAWLEALQADVRQQLIKEQPKAIQPALVSALAQDPDRLASRGESAIKEIAAAIGRAHRQRSKDAATLA